jgi:hypothetical protein
MDRGPAIRKMPDDVQDLRNEWKSRAKRIKGLTWELEQDFRFGQSVTKTDRGYVMGGTIKGGSSSMWYPATQDQYHAFKRWQSAEGIYEARDDEAYDALRALLAETNVELITRRSPMARTRRRGRPDPEPFPGYGPVYGDMLSMLKRLPREHLERDSLKAIQLGGWGPDAAKASAYKDGVVMMYDFATRGARRTFLGLFLHELGHAHEVDMTEAVRTSLYTQYQILIEEDAFFGIEFLVDGDTRKLYQKFVFVEFLAETYMIYAACGEGMRALIAALDDRARDAWTTVYEIFRESFFGIDYE